jgi:RNAse (barnase) inhibitor barstar
VSERSIAPLPNLARVNLRTYAADLQLGTLTVGVDNIHYDVFLSPKFAETTRTYLLDLIRQTTNLTLSAVETRSKTPETGAWKKQLAELLQASITRAKYEKNIELDLLLRVALLKFLTQEIANQFAHLMLEGKEWVRTRGSHYEHGEQGHLMKARLAELQADRRNIFRQVGQQVYQILAEVEENFVGKSRRALFGDQFGETYDLLKNRLVFVEAGKDDALFLEQYVLLGNYLKDQDRFETIDTLLLDFLREFVLAGDQGEEMNQAWKTYNTEVDAALRTRSELARLEEEKDGLQRRTEGGGDLLERLRWRGDPATARAALADAETRHKHLQQKLEELGPRLEAAKRKAEFLAEQYQSRLGDYLNQPGNARRLFDPDCAGEGAESAELRARLLEEWISRLEQRDLLVHVLASYELRNLYLDYCPPVHLQQLKRALVFREELKHVEDILKQFPARRFSMKRIEDLARKLRRYPHEEARALAIRFAEDFMRLRRDVHNYRLLAALMERVNLVRAEKTRELSRMNNSLYEYMLPDEARPVEDKVVSHAIIKADIRGSTKITQDLLARGLNPASHFSLNFHEPVKRILERYGAAKVFIEGDAIVLAIFETESNRSHQRAVAKACLLAREILAVSGAYNDRAQASDLPRLELGVGVAFQGSSPTYWVDGDSRIMISRALNLSDRLSSCSKVARRLLAQHSSLFRMFLFQTVMQGASDEEAEEFLIRFNLNGVQLNEEGFAKLSEEISLSPVEAECPMPWGRERATFYCGEVPIGEGLEPLVIRKGLVRQLLPDGKIGAEGTHPYYEICISPEVFELVGARSTSAVAKD